MECSFPAPASLAEHVAPGVVEQPLTSAPRWRALTVFALVLTGLFAKPLFDLSRYAAKEELYSHAFLVPVIAFYLAWQKRGILFSLPLLPSVKHAALATIFGFSALAIYFLIGRGWRLNNYLSITMFAYVCFFAGGALFFLGRHTCRQLAFPLSFLLFLVPFPLVVTHAIEVFFQHTSAAAADVLFNLTGTSVFRDGMSFHLPGFALRVAEECSGIRSSFVLFITSVLAGHMFLRSAWKRWLLAFFVIPLGIVRNGIRIVTIGMLCLHVDHSMIDSPIHHHGGPLFFAMSLVPFFALLLCLWRSERRQVARIGSSGGSSSRGVSDPRTLSNT